MRELLDELAARAPKFVDEIVPALVPVSVLHRTLRQLLAERVSIRDLETILETLAEHAPRVQDPDLLTDLVRQRLARTITRPHVGSDGVLHVLTLEPTLDERLRGAVQRTDQGTFFSLDAPTLERLVRGIERAVATVRERGAVLLASPTIRAPLRQIVSRIDPRMAVISHNELPPELRIVGAGAVELADAR